MIRVRSLRLLIPLGVFMIFLSIMGLSLLNSVGQREQSMAKEARERGQNNVALLMRHAERFLRNDPQVLGEDIARMAIDPALRKALLIQPDGRVRFANHVSWHQAMAQEVLTPEEMKLRAQALQTRAALYLEKTKPYRVVLMMSYAEPGDGQLLRNLERGVIVLSYDLSGASSEARRIALEERVPELVALVLAALLLVLVLNAYITEPLRKLRHAAQGMARGEYTKVSVHRAAEEIRSLTKSFDDMSDQISSQVQVLREQAQHTQAILDNMVDGVITIDGRGIVQSFNPSAERIFGYSAEEVIGHNVNMLMPNPYREEHDRYLKNYQTTRVARIIGIGREVQGQRKDGGLFPMDLAVSEIMHQGQVMYVGMVRDITERKVMENMKNEFVSMVSHELRTPLTSISGALGLISGGALGETPPQMRQMLEIAKKNSLRLTHLINDLLDIEKIAAGKLHFDMSPQPLFPLVQQALEGIRGYSLERKVSVVLHGESVDCMVRVDTQRMLQVLANLLSNAVKFSPENGQVELGLSLGTDQVRISVRDHGPGIPASFRERIFQRFSQADSSDTRQKGGTGLGLAITKSLVERMAGNIDFESTEGQGALFFVDLPLWHDKEMGLKPISVALPGAPRLLVVEDEPDVAHLLAEMLQQAGYAVDIAANGEMALLAIAQQSYDAMTLDLLLPDLDGLDILRAVRMNPKTEALPIIVVSAWIEDGKLSLHGDVSGVEWIAKPINRQRLLACLEEKLPKQRISTPHILHVEDDGDLQQVVQGMLGNFVQVEVSTTVREARTRIALERFDVVILDITLPDGSGWELLPEIHSQQPDARVIVLTGADINAEQATQVHAYFKKSQVSSRQLLDAIHDQIRKAR